MKKYFLLVLASAIFITGCSDSNNNAESSYGGSIEATDGLIYDFGQIDINGGIVSKVFKFKNTDTQSLAIYEAATSCGCTTGKISVQNKEFGPFGMHDQTQEVVEVAAGKDFTVEIFYDPLFHGPDDLGERQRTFFLFSSAQADGETVRAYSGKFNFTEISVKGIVVSSK